MNTNNNPTQSSEVSTDTKTIITILLLIFIYPVGLILMWFWTSWKRWVKILVSLPVILLIFLPFLVGILLAAINPPAQIKKANCVKLCELSATKNSCIESCLKGTITPIQVPGPTSK